MKSKLLKIISILLVSLFGFVLYAMHVIEVQLVDKIPTILAQNTLIPITTGPIRRGRCILNACLIIPDVVVHPTNQQALSLGTISLSIPPLWPIRSTIQNTSSPFLVDMTLGGHHWDIRHLSGQIGSFSFDTNGFIHPRNETGQITLHTTGLKTFLTNTFDLPPLVTWLFSDDPSTLSLIPQKGWLRCQGIPVIPLTH